MVSTFFDFQQINTNLKKSLERVGSETVVERDTKYYKDNIGKIKTVDDFMKDYRLYSYAMKAHGLEDMTYAKAFMKKVLESDLTDDNSYANKLSDSRYRNFAAAFQFNSGTAIAQTTNQIDDVIAEHKAMITELNDTVTADTNYYKAAISTVTNVDELLSNDRLRSYVLKAFDVDTPYWNRDHLTKVLTSDVNDPNSYVNQMTGSKVANYKAMAEAFNFNATGTLDAGVLAQDATEAYGVTDAYVHEVPGRPIAITAQYDTDYYKSKIGSFTNVDDMLADSRIVSTIKTAYGLDSTTLKSTIRNILTSDLNDPNNYAKTFGGSNFESIASSFNFLPDGTVASGKTAQDTDKTVFAMSRYTTLFDDGQEESDAGTYSFYSAMMGTVDNVSDITGTTRLYNFIVEAFGFDPATTSKDKVLKAMTSDLNDPKSFANTQKDPRFAELARAFNFDSKGAATAPALAQSQNDITQTARDYIVRKTRYGNDDKKDAAQKEASYYTAQIQKVESVDELLKDKRLVNFILEAKGIDPAKVTADTLKKAFASDPTDPKSFVNLQTETRLRDVVASFNFDTKGQINEKAGDTIQSRGELLETEELYLRQTLEEQSGEDNNGLRLALYFTRQAPNINTAFDILADSALIEVFRTAFDLPKEISSMDIEKQKVLVEKNLNLADLQDPAKLTKFINRFTAFYDLANDSSASVLTLFNNSSSASISADTLFSLAQLKNR